MGSMTMWHREQLGSILWCSIRSRMLAAEVGTFVAAAHTGLVAVHQAHVLAEVAARGCVLRIVILGLIFRVFALLAIPCRRGAASTTSGEAPARQPTP